MKVNKLSALGGIAGVVIMISSWIRYFILFPDLDKAIIYGAVGFLIVMVSFLYNHIAKINTTLYDVEEYLANESKSGKTYGK